MLVSTVRGRLARLDDEEGRDVDGKPEHANHHENEPRLVYVCEQLRPRHAAETSLVEPIGRAADSATIAQDTQCLAGSWQLSVQQSFV